MKRHHRNRRFSREHLLDVRLSANERRRRRLRRGTLLLGTTAVVLLIVLIVWQGGQMAVLRLIDRNPAFGITTLSIETDGILSAEQIRTWAGVRPKDNLLSLSLGRVERDLKLVPAIESVVVERVLPGTLRIQVTEREPIAQVVFPQLHADGFEGGVYTLDANGVFMFPIYPSQRTAPAVATNDHLPIISGIALRDVRPGRATDSLQVRAAVALVQAFDRSPMMGLVDLKQIDVGTPGVLVVTTAQGNQVTVGLSDFDLLLHRWRTVHEHALRFGKHIVALDLAVANNAPMLWTDLNAMPPPPPPKPIKISPYKKRHV